MSRADIFRGLAQEHSTAIATYLRHRLYPLARADLDELVEDVLIVAWRRLDRIPKGSERPWLIGVARNVLRNSKRAHVRRSKAESSVAATDDEPSAEMWVVASASIRDAMSQLTASDRDLLMMHHWEGLSAGDIAVVLGISGKAAESRLLRARARFERAFEESSVQSCESPVSNRPANREEYQ